MQGITPAASSNYTVTGTDQNTGCTGTAVITQIVSACTGISRLALENGILIYPNPAHNLLTLELFENGSADMEIRDITGRMITSGKLQQGKTDLDISSYTNGLYYLNIPSRNGAKVFKFIKE